MKTDTSALKNILRETMPTGPPEEVSYHPTCVFLLLFDKEEPHVLAIQKSDTDGYPWRNQVALPGGHVDISDPSPRHAAFRELEEELCIPGSQVDFIGSMGHFPTINRKDIEVFTGVWDGTGPVHYDPGEIARVLEVPLKNLLRTHETQNFHGRVPDLHELVYPFQDVKIWGATARILHYFIELLYAHLRNGYVGK